MASFSSTYPSQRPVFTLDASNAGRLDPRCSFSRASTGTFFGTEKVLSSENLIPDSNASQAWQTVRVTRTTSGSFLDGSDSFLIAENSDTGSHYTSPNSGANATNFVSGTEYTAVVFAKAGTDNVIQVAFPAGYFTSNAYANFDLSNASTTPVTGSAATATITALGSDWVKLTLTAPATATGAAVGVVVAFIQNDINGSRIPSYAGDTASNVYLWEANVSSTGQKVLNQTSGTIHREYQTKLQTAASGAARFEHSATDGQSAGTSLGILVESQVANVMAYSRNGFNASNSFQYTLHSGVTATENAAVGPSGSLDATLLSEDSTTGAHQLQTTETVTSAAHTVSVYVKPVGAPSFGIRISSGTVYGSVFTFSDESFTNYGTAPEASRIESVGGGWYRLSITQTVTSGSSLIRFNLFDSGGNASYAGNGYNGILLFGFQCEANSFPSSWVDTGTSGSTATRAADSLSVATADIGYTGGPVSIVAETEAGAGLGDNPRLFNLNDGSDTTRLMLYKNNASADNTVAWTAYYGTSGMGTLSGSNNSSKVAVSVDTNDFAATSDTGALLTNASGSQHSFTHLYLGSNYNGTAHHLNGHVKRVALYNEALSDTNLQALTS